MVPPGAIVKVSDPIAIVVVMIGIGIMVVELERTNVSDTAVVGGYGLGSISSRQ